MFVDDGWNGPDGKTLLFPAKLGQHLDARSIFVLDTRLPLLYFMDHPHSPKGTFLGEPNVDGERRLRPRFADRGPGSPWIRPPGAQRRLG
jgi:hypothetical protein